jgi:anti-sigma factor RsiW
MQRPEGCAVCEAMLPEAVDHALSAEEQRVFDAHVAGCSECARELAEAQRGQAWMSLLKNYAPEPPAMLLEKILAQTSEPVLAAIPAVVKPAVPAWAISSIATRMWKAAGAAFRADGRLSHQPRLAMTAAMAFFSIALTLNLSGVRLQDMRAANFTPSALRRTVADASASVTRTFENNRSVYQVESRLDELRSPDKPGN